MSDEEKGDKLKVWFEAETEFMCVAYPAGRLDAVTARAVMDALIPYQNERGREASFMLVDARFLTGMTPEARQAFGAARYGESQAMSYIAVFGGSFAFRALANLVIKGLMLVAKQMVMTVAGDEASARAWLAEHKRAYLARAAKN